MTRHVTTHRPPTRVADASHRVSVLSQLMKLKKLMRKREHAAMRGNPAKVNNIQERINYLKWQIQNQG